ncbi:MAG: hypothetical protein P8X74_03635 [Reinekea sp.]
MPQDFDLRINGQNIKIIDARLMQTFDTACDGFTATILCDPVKEPDLYAALKPYHAPRSQVYLDGKLTLTGKLTDPGPSKSASGVVYNIKGFSNTFNFVDSQLVPPYEKTGLALDKLAVDIASQTNTRVIFEGSPGGVFERVTAQQGQTGFEFLNPLAQQRQFSLSCSADGNLLIRQANISQKPVGTIEENGQFQEEFSASFDYRKRFRTCKIISRRWDGAHESVSTDDNINDPRHIQVQANDQVKGGLEANASYQLKRRILESMRKTIPVVGWYAPNNTLWQAGTLVTEISPTLFNPNGWTYFINRVEFSYDGSAGKMANLELIPKEIFSNEPLHEPWFDSDVVDILLQHQNTRLG